MKALLPRHTKQLHDDLRFIVGVFLAVSTLVGFVLALHLA
jgi:hypothetical protein